MIAESVNFSERSTAAEQSAGRSHTDSAVDSHVQFTDGQPRFISGIIFRPRRSTTYVDAASCYRWSSVVCLEASLFVGFAMIITTTTVLRPFLRDHPGEPVREENFWTLWCKGRLT